MSMTSTIAEAVAALIRASDIDVEVSVTWMPSQEISELRSGPPRVTIYPRSRNPVGSETRGEARIEHTIDIAMQALVNLVNPDTVLNDSVDALVDIAEDISDLLHRMSIGIQGVAWLDTEHEPLCDYEALVTKQVFLSLISVTYFEARP